VRGASAPREYVHLGRIGVLDRNPCRWGRKRARLTSHSSARGARKPPMFFSIPVGGSGTCGNMPLDWF
jgi:hypothetical protein